MYQLKVTSQSGVEPVSLNVVKNFIKYDESESQEEALISELVTAARELIESYCDIAMIEKTYEFLFDGYSINSKRVDIPARHLVEFTSLTYISPAKVETELTEGEDFYIYDTEIVFSSYNSDGYYKAVYTAGYGDETELLPGALKVAICETVFDWWENRGQSSMSLPKSVIAKIAPYAKQTVI